MSNFRKIGLIVFLLIVVSVCPFIQLSCAAPSTTPAQATSLLVSAASSLTDALKEINTLYSAQNPNLTISNNFAASGTLQAQIQNGAPVDIFISAAAAQMDNLQKAQLIVDDTRKNLLKNSIVLIVPSDSVVELSDFKGLISEKIKRVAMGDPKSVPAGIYAQQLFEQLGIASQLQPKLIFGGDVRQILTYVESGNVDAGVVYSTDAKISTKVKIVATAPENINAKIVYPVAVIKASKNIAAARGYEDFLFGAKAKAIFEKYGFSMATN